MAKARGGFDVVVGAVAVVVVGWIAWKIVAGLLGAVFFGLKVLVAIAVVAVGLKMLDAVLSRRELRAGGARRLNP